MITVKIDVTKIDKAKLFRGTKGVYLEIVLLENRDGEDQYGNSHMAVQGMSKEERAAGKRGAILGNAKTFAPREPSLPTTRPESTLASPEDDDIPF